MGGDRGLQTVRQAHRKPGTDPEGTLVPSGRSDRRPVGFGIANFGFRIYRPKRRTRTPNLTPEPQSSVIRLFTVEKIRNSQSKICPLSTLPKRGLWNRRFHSMNCSDAFKSAQKLQPRPIDQFALPVSDNIISVGRRADHPALHPHLLLVKH